MKALLRFAAHVLVITTFVFLQQGLLGAEARADKTKDQKVPHGQKHKIDLNHATEAELEALPGVGPVIAKEIIAARPFKSVNDLKSVNGIGDAKLKELRPLVTVSDHPSAKATGTAREPGTVREPGSGAPAKSSQGSSASTSRSADRSASRTPAATGKINLNTASQAELESLPGIGPVKARAIIDNRPYHSVEDVMKVKGIKEGTFNEIKDQVTVR